MNSRSFSTTEAMHIMGRITSVSTYFECSCRAAAPDFAKEKEEEIHQFVMGLNDVRFGGLCTTIVAINPFLSLGEIYAKIIYEEHHLVLAPIREHQLPHSPRVIELLCVQVPKRNWPRQKNLAAHQTMPCEYKDRM